jgi:hypothetical protein
MIANGREWGATTKGERKGGVPPPHVPGRRVGGGKGRGEILAVLLGSRVLEQYHGTPVAKQLGHIFEKLAELLPEKVRVRPEDMFIKFPGYTKHTRCGCCSPRRAPSGWRIGNGTRNRFCGGGGRVNLRSVFRQKAFMRSSGGYWPGGTTCGCWSRRRCGRPFRRRSG